MPETVKLIECPRDAMQGLEVFIPTEIKASYINQLLKAGFDTIDFGSFVSPKAVPQMKDTAEVLKLLDLSSTRSKLLAIVANVRGAEDALQFEEISCLGFPLSVSETFQRKNTNRSIEEAFGIVQKIQDLCLKKNRTLVLYISMGFGNPYGDPYDAASIRGFVERLDAMGIAIVSLSDTVGAADKDTITFLFETLIPSFPHIEFGAHLHTESSTAFQKISAAVKAGCRRFDGAIRGFGGCPMAENKLVGNMPTEMLVDYFLSHNFKLSLDKQNFEKAQAMALEVFPL